MAVLVTGGLGYIGSHTAVALIEKGIKVVICDDLSNSDINALDRIFKITNVRPKFHKTDLKDYKKTELIFKRNSIDAVIHFAGYKAVGESVEKPVMYYENNLLSTLNLLKAMKKFNVKNFVFSSSATVYKVSDIMPLKENFPLAQTNPYGRSKYFIEEILHDVCISDKNMNVAALRYFNPIGAHKSGLLGENPNGIPNNLMPFITKVAIGKFDKLKVFGNDYPTKDGTGVRDYIHVLDLAKGHICALEKLKEKPGFFVCNLGTGKGYSVLEIVKEFEKQSGVEIPYEITKRRPGDIAECYADCEKAEKELGFKAEYSLADMCRDSWNFQKNNPDGYKSAQ